MTAIGLSTQNNSEFNHLPSKLVSVQERQGSEMRRWQGGPQPSPGALRREVREGQHGGHSWDPNSGGGGKARQRSRQSSMTASGWDGRESRETLRETRESSRGRQQVEGGGRLVVNLRESPGSRSSSRAGEEERNQAVKEVSRGSLQLTEERREVRRAEDVWRPEEIKRVEPRREEPVRRSGSIDTAADAGGQYRITQILCNVGAKSLIRGGLSHRWVGRGGVGWGDSSTSVMDWSPRTAQCGYRH